MSTFTGASNNDLFCKIGSSEIVMNLGGPRTSTSFVDRAVGTELSPIPRVRLVPVRRRKRALLRMGMGTKALAPCCCCRSKAHATCMQINGRDMRYGSRRLLSLMLGSARVA